MAAHPSKFQEDPHDADREAKREFKKVAERAASAAHSAEGEARDFASRASGEARVIESKVKDLAGKAQDAMSQSISDRPKTMLVMAGVAGFLLGAVWKS